MMDGHRPALWAWLPSTFDPWPPTRAGHAGRGWRVEAGIKAQPGDQAQVAARTAQQRRALMLDLPRSELRNQDTSSPCGSYSFGREDAFRRLVISPVMRRRGY